MDVVRPAALDVAPGRGGDVQPSPQGADSCAEGFGCVGLRLAGLVERGDLRKDGLKAVRGIDCHGLLQGDVLTGEGKVLDEVVACGGHGRKVTWRR